MYSSKPLSKWSGALFLSSSEPYIPKHEIERKTIDSRFRGAQFKCNPTKRGRDGLFTTMKIWKYQNPNAILPKYKAKTNNKKGFGMSDVADRTRLLNQITQNQWNERIKSERQCMRSRSSPNLLRDKKMKKSTKKRKRTMSSIRPKRREYDVAHDASHVFAKERYKIYKRPMSADPRTSSYVYTSSLKNHHFNKNKRFQKSKHVRVAITKEFYSHHRHLSIPHLLHRQVNSALFS